MSYPQHYKLNANRKPVMCEADEAMCWRGQNPKLCTVNYTEIGGVQVSTIFLPFDHGHGLEPLIFETAVFEDNGDVKIVGRVSTWEQAEAMHNAAIKKWSS